MSGYTINWFKPASLSNNYIDAIIRRKYDTINLDEISCIISTKIPIFYLRWVIPMRNEDKYNNYFTNTTVGIFQISPDGHYIMVNPAFAHLLGYGSPEDLLSSVTDIGKQLYVNAQEHDKYMQQVLENGSYSFGVNLYRKDGSTAWIYNNVRVVRHNNGNIDYFEGVSQDITQGKETIAYLTDVNEKLKQEIAEHKIIEEKLKLSQARLERKKLYLLLDGLPAIIYLRDADYSIHFSNRHFWNVFERPRNKRCFEVMHHRQEPCEDCPANRVLSTKIPATWEELYPNDRIFEIYSYPFHDINDSPLVLQLLIDITSKKQYEQEMTRLSKLNLIGEMAAGLAHEIRNPMTIVKGFLQLLRKKEVYRQDKEYFELMIQELDRTNSMISEFLSLSKNKAVDFSVQNLNHIVNSLFPLIQADAAESGKYVILELNEITDLLLNEKEIRQLILNLTRNGLEALLSGGCLKIKTHIEDNEVILSVQDSGSGIPEGVIDKIGTPFFTTKENGTGLGLATCYSIALRHNAKINFNTGPDGTTFYVKFKV